MKKCVLIEQQLTVTSISAAKTLLSNLHIYCLLFPDLKFKQMCRLICRRGTASVAALLTSA